MKSNENTWRLGETVILPRTEKKIKNNGSVSYEQLIGSRYICVREEAEGRRGILVKVLGKYTPEHVITVGGHPFSKDDRFDAYQSEVEILGKQDWTPYAGFEDSPMLWCLFGTDTYSIP